jgi:hypothetical protein
MRILSKNIDFEKRLLWSMLFIGFVLRLLQYVANRSLWLDEAMLARNIIDHSFAQLFSPLDYNQGAPILFLLMQRALVLLFGGQDYILRLFPFFCGMISLILFYFFFQQIKMGMSRWLMIIWFAISIPLIWYSSEAKQYSTDVAISLLLWVLALHYLRSNRPRTYLLGLGAAGAIGLWFSHPALFTLMGIATGLLFQCFYPSTNSGDIESADHGRFCTPIKPKQLKHLVILFTFWLISFLLFYKVSLAGLSANTILRDSWLHAFMPLPPWHNLRWFPATVYHVMQHPLGLETKIIALFGGILFFVGIIRLFRRFPSAAVMFCATLVLMLLASAVEKYPFADRFLLFFLPVIMLFLSEGLEEISRFFPKTWKKLGTILIIIVLLIFPAIRTVSNTIHPDMGDHIKPIMAYVRDHRQPQDVIYVYYGAKHAFLFYSSSYGFKPGDYTIGVKSRQAPEAYLKDIQSFRGKGRVWILFSHSCSWCKVDEHEFYLKHLDEVGHNLDKVLSNSASAYLYDL